MKQTGTCVRARDGSRLSAVSWVDGKEIWVHITVVNGGSVEDIVLSGLDALIFANDLRDTIKNAELL